MNKKTIYINGRFTAQRMTGVQRVSLNLVLALDELMGLADQRAQRWILLVPPGAPALKLRHIEVQALRFPGWMNLHLWEQLALPWIARHGLLLNFTGAAPFFAGHQFSMLHDAAVFDHPEAYSTAFRHWYRWLFRRQGKTAVRLFAPSEFSRQRLITCLGLNAQRATQLILLPGAAEHFDQIEADSAVLKQHQLEGKPFFLAVASRNRTKNLACLLSAQALWPPEQSIPLLIVGGANSRVFASEKPVETAANVIFTGPVTDAQLKHLYMHARAFIFPSTYEGFGLPPLEAMRCACPVAVARSASLPEVCADAALYFDPDSPEELFACMQELASSEDLRGELRHAGLLRSAQFSWLGSARRVIATIQTLD